MLRFCALLKEEFQGALAKDVEDNLHRLDAGVFDGLERLLDFLDADAVVPNFARPLEIVERGKGFRLVIDSSRRAVKLNQVERLHYVNFAG